MFYLTVTKSASGATTLTGVFYQARFQIEFRFRDAQQFLGLTPCQARGGPARHFHFNATLTALNLIKFEDRCYRSEPNQPVISVASWKIRPANAHLLERFSCHFGLDFTSIQSRPDLE